MCPERQRHIRSGLVAVPLLLAAATAMADERPQFLARADALKEQALQLSFRAADQAGSDRDHQAPETSVYLSAGNSGASMLAVGLSIDGAAPAFSGPLRPDETQALQPGRMTYRLARLQLTPSVHHLHLEVLLKYGGDEEARSLVLEEDCAITAAGDLVAAPEGRSWLSSPHLSLHRQMAGPVEGPGLIDLRKIWDQVNGPEVRDGAYRPGSEHDPLLGYARLLIATGDDFKAAVLLHGMAANVPEAALPAEYFQALAEAQLGVDAPALAQAAYVKALAAGLDASAAADLRVRIGERYYQRDDYAGAERAMGEEPPRQAKTQYTRWQDLRSRVLLAQKRFQEASPALAAARAGADFDSYVRYYNFGVSLIENGLGPQGVTVLDRVGTIPSNDRRMIVLRDNANLALGNYLLQSGQGATAIPVLERIEVYGPYSDRAILNLGWAWLAPAGTQQMRVMLGDERMQGAPPESLGALRHAFDGKNVYQRYHLSPFIRARLDNDHAVRVKHALETWSELFGRDTASDAVQEAFLAAGMAFESLGAHRESAELYNRGIDALEAARKINDAAERYVRSDKWVADLLQADRSSTRLDVELRRLPRSAISTQLNGYMAGWEFQNGMLQYRTLDNLASNLKQEGAFAGEAADLQQDVELLESRIEQLKEEDVELMRRQLLDQISMRQLRLAKLLEGGRFELARVYDGVAR
jgi:hypothetical protein